MILEEKLAEEIETKEILQDNEAGFRKGRRSNVDNICILNFNLRFRDDITDLQCFAKIIESIIRSVTQICNKTDSAMLSFANVFTE